MKMIKEIAKWMIPAAALSFFVGYGAKSLVNDTVNYQQETSCEQNVEQPAMSFGRSLFVPSHTTYERVPNQVNRNMLQEIRIDHGGDGTIDDTITFFTRRTGAITAENAIAFYDGWPGSDYIFGNLREKIRLPDDITNDQYRRRAKEILAEKGYDPGSLANFDFF